MIRIATRKSPLAIWQAEYVQRLLLAYHPHLSVELLPLTTRGDQILEDSLVKFGGKNLFVKELENALLNGQADIAVHSMKDVPVALIDELILPVVCQRTEPHDAFVSNKYTNFDELPSGAIVGTSSLRRQCQLMFLRDDLNTQALRGNINTRLAKLDAGEFDAIILAAVGLQRLGLSDRIQQIFDFDQMLPAAGQGALAIECRIGDQPTLDLISALNHEQTAICVQAERQICDILGGNCHTPVAAYAEIFQDELIVKGLVGYPDGSEIVRSQVSGTIAQAKDLGTQVGQQLLQQGGAAILQSLYP
ncbi:MAG: hydroxymethylbilane synthase [Gammaproteobacteria bacterium]